MKPARRRISMAFALVASSGGMAACGGEDDPQVEDGEVDALGRRRWRTWSPTRTPTVTPTAGIWRLH